jgi:hypothetical protein
MKGFLQVKFGECDDQKLSLAKMFGNTLKIKLANKKLRKIGKFSKRYENYIHKHYIRNLTFP